MTTHLTDTQQQTIRIALAYWAGWSEISAEELIGRERPQCNWGKPIPNYPTSLDACHAIEVKLTDEEHERFQRELALFLLPDFRLGRVMNAKEKRQIISAKAEHRALALYRSLNLGELGD